MKIEVLFFGRLTEIVGAERINLENISDTDALNAHLWVLYPALQQLQYKIALNQKVIHANKALAAGMTVAVMPPFSGG
jgi:molybdopterin synthase sulfur carrier subunit